MFLLPSHDLVMDISVESHLVYFLVKKVIHHLLIGYLFQGSGVKMSGRQGRRRLGVETSLKCGNLKTHTKRKFFTLDGKTVANVLLS